ncbi:hypothetical protein HPB52_013485 [Rhipicephalus sanguineus]|uniref:Tick transposon n=1 Tax=Rhipicephalus sanguineus TaxID=34632 RepID=A0A9D4PF66_RHISA|nr:hypothetical protein HPB52_013485 [Rhipicephalus sanguineus]
MIAITGSIWTARLYAYSLKHSYLPPEVALLFGALMPSEGHVKRVCRILRSEACRQVRFYTDCLQVVNRNELPFPSAQKKFLQDLRLASQTADFLWGNVIVQLPRNKHRSPGQGQEVKVLGDASIPKNVADLLKLGPKFCEHPDLDKTELLSLPPPPLLQLLDVQSELDNLSKPRKQACELHQSAVAKFYEGLMQSLLVFTNGSVRDSARLAATVCVITTTGTIIWGCLPFHSTCTAAELAGLHLVAD